MLQSHGQQPAASTFTSTSTTTTTPSLPLSITSDSHLQSHPVNHAPSSFPFSASISCLANTDHGPSTASSYFSPSLRVRDLDVHSKLRQPLSVNSWHCARNPSPLTIPELLLQICLYLDSKALIHASQVSRSFRVCCEPLLWTDVPEGAWRNSFFRTNWTLHADKIRSLTCGPGVDLKLIAKHCHGLISLDVSKIMERGVMGQSPVSEASCTSLGLDGSESYKDHMRVGSISKPGMQSPLNYHTSNHPLNNTNSIRAAVNIDKSRPITNNGKACTSQDDTTAHNIIRRNSASLYTTFHEMADCLVVLLQQNPRLRCLRLQPLGMFPRPLLTALSQLSDLRLLFLNGWQDFQEYSFQLILEACRSLEHLSLGENDFTRFTLESMALTSVSSRYQQHLRQTACAEKVLRLEKFDDPLKSTSGLAPLTGQTYVEPSLKDFHSTRAVLVSSSTLASEGALAYELYLQQLCQQHSGAVHSDPLSSILPYGQQAAHTSPTLAHRPDPSFPASHKQQQGQQPQQQTQIRSLNLDHTGLRQEFLLNLANQCPRLVHLSVQASWGLYPSSNFMQLLRFTCPELKRFQFRDQGKDLQDEFFLQMIDQFSDQLEWLHAGKTGFSQAALAALLRQQTQIRPCQDSLLQGQSTPFKGLVSLNVDGVRGIQSKSLIQVFEQCCGLKVLSAQGVVLNGRDLFQPSSGLIPWSCHDLETLVIDIEIYAAVAIAPPQQSVETVRCGVYHQLGRLTRLRHLGLGGGHCIRGPKNDHGVDLTLESGLDALSGLHCLEHLDVHRLVQHIRQAELAWMVHHWPRLRKIEAKKEISRSMYTQSSSSPLGQQLGANNDCRIANIGPGGSMNKAIEWLAQARPGIEICLYLLSL
ncbi:MAG: hypothetical protein BYD32DRAFT_25010 [Podila humilis]|nr:MAG: hypothetical protein BYD32DRAFT_25010 [Podila humilis]